MDELWETHGGVTMRSAEAFVRYNTTTSSPPNRKKIFAFVSDWNKSNNEVMEVRQQILKTDIGKTNTIRHHMRPQAHMIRCFDPSWISDCLEVSKLLNPFCYLSSSSGRRRVMFTDRDRGNVVMDKEECLNRLERLFAAGEMSRVTKQPASEPDDGDMLFVRECMSSSDTIVATAACNVMRHWNIRVFEDMYSVAMSDPVIFRESHTRILEIVRDMTTSGDPVIKILAQAMRNRLKHDAGTATKMTDVVATAEMSSLSSNKRKKKKNIKRKMLHCYGKKYNKTSREEKTKTKRKRRMNDEFLTKTRTTTRNDEINSRCIVCDTNESIGATYCGRCLTLTNETVSELNTLSFELSGNKKLAARAILDENEDAHIHADFVRFTEYDDRYTRELDALRPQSSDVLTVDATDDIAFNFLCLLGKRKMHLWKRRAAFLRRHDAGCEASAKLETPKKNETKID